LSAQGRWKAWNPRRNSERFNWSTWGSTTAENSVRNVREPIRVMICSSAISVMMDIICFVSRFLCWKSRIRIGTALPVKRRLRRSSWGIKGRRI